MTKEVLRKRILARLRAQPVKYRRQRSLEIRKKLFSLQEFQESRNVCFYVSLPQEVNTRPMIRRALLLGKRVFVPRIDKKKSEISFRRIENLKRDLEKGTFAIWEPKLRATRAVAPSTLDLVVAPGLLFDRHNHRLGRGGGFYDRFLARLPRRVFKVGLGFSFQRISRLPREAHDRKLDLVLVD